MHFDESFTALPGVADEKNASQDSTGHGASSESYIPVPPSSTVASDQQGSESADEDEEVSDDGLGARHDELTLHLLTHKPADPQH
eukprot:11188621-Lingulodinium_polyedra.AAC.1